MIGVPTHCHAGESLFDRLSLDDIETTVRPSQVTIVPSKFY